MAHAEKKISVSDLTQIAESNMITETVTWEKDITFEVRRCIGLKQMLELVDDTVTSCFGETGEYLPEAMDFALKSGIIRKYTNIPLSENLERRYAFLYYTDIISVVCAHISQIQLNEIVTSVHKKIEHQCDANVRELRIRMERLIAAFEDVMEKSGELMESITPEGIGSLVTALQGGVDEEKLVEAYLKQKEGQ